MLSLIQKMSVDALKNWAWTRAVRFCGGVTACSVLLGVSQSTVSKWLSHVSKKIPYEHAVIISHFTKIPLKYLSPLTKAANQAIKEMCLVKNAIPFVTQRCH